MCVCVCVRVYIRICESVLINIDIYSYTTTAVRSSEERVRERAHQLKGELRRRMFDANGGGGAGDATTMSSMTMADRLHAMSLLFAFLYLGSMASGSPQVPYMFLCI